MKSYIFACAATAGALLLAGCAGQQLSQAEKVKPAGSAFEQSLYTGYVDLAKEEYAGGDYRDSDAYARRAMQAAGGSAVAPEATEARRLPTDNVAELTSERTRLVSALGAGAATKDPANAAEAQVMFDCWMEQQEENWQAEDIARCRTGYLAAMDRLQPSMAALPAPKPVRFTVYFDNNKAELSNEAQAVIAEAKAAARKTDGGIIKISGNADRVGTGDYNKVLSELRADAVAKVMATERLPVKAVLTEGLGEARPAVLTADGVSEPRNRRVDIIIEP